MAPGRSRHGGVRACTGRRCANLSAKHKHGIMTINVEALFPAMESNADIRLVQEHRLDNPGYCGTSAKTTQLVRGGGLSRGAVAVVSWTRRNRLLTGSVPKRQTLGKLKPGPNFSRNAENT